MWDLDNPNNHINLWEDRRAELRKIISENISKGLSDDVLKDLSQKEHYIDIWDCDFDEAVELLLEAKKKDPNCFIIFGYHKIDANTREEAYLQYYWLTPEQFDEAMGGSNNN